MKKSIKNIFGYLVANSLIILGFVRNAKKMALNNECILSIYFHMPSKREFESAVKWLKKNRFHFLSTADIERIINNDIPFPKGGVLLTVDDGWQSNETNVIEVANKYCVPVTIFVSTAPVEEGAYWWSYIHKAKQHGFTYISKNTLKRIPNEERLSKINAIKKEVTLKREAMTVEQVKSAANSKYITIGAHTHTHPILINCNEEQAYDELKVSREKLESWIGKEVPFFAYTNGDYSTREIKILKSLNYRLAFSTQPRYLTPNLLDDNYSLPRFLFLEGVSFAENICRMVGVWQPLMLKLKNFISFKRKNMINERNDDKEIAFFR